MDQGKFALNLEGLALNHEGWSFVAQGRFALNHEGIALNQEGWPSVQGQVVRGSTKDLS